MRNLWDFLEYLYELDFSYIDVPSLLRALVSFGISLSFVYLGKFTLENFGYYFLYLMIPLALFIAYPAYTGVIALKKAFRKKEEYIVYATDDGLRSKKI